MKTYKLLDSDTVAIFDEDGISRSSCLLSAVPDDAVILPADPPTKEELKARVTAKREQVETGGTTVAGMQVKTDAGSQAKLTGALNFVGRNPNRTIKWKKADSTFAAINKATIETLSDAVGEFVTKCFDAEAAHYAAIDALTTPEQLAAYDITTGWPT